METKETFGQFLADRGKRALLASAGLLLFSVGVYVQMQANLGVQPWVALRQGLGTKLSITYGTASILVSLTLVVIDLIMHERIGIGTLLDAFLVGIGTDICISIGFMPVQTNLVLQVAALFGGTVICCVGQWMYMMAALSCGPGDSFLIGIGKKFPKRPIGQVNMGIQVVVLALSIALKGPIGIGTVLTVFGTGVIMDAVFKVLRFKPREVVHEGLMDTAAAFMRAVQK